MKQFFTFSFVLILTLCLNAQTIDKPQKRRVIGKNNITKKKNLSKVISILSEDFEGGTMPSGWTEEIGNSTQSWVFTTDGSSEYWEIPEHTIYTCVNDDKYNCDMSDMWLISPSVDLSSHTSIILNVDYMAPTFANDIHSVKVSTNGGTTWETVLTLEKFDAWHNLELNLSDYAGANNFKIAFHYNDGNEYSYGLAIDNVLLYEPSPHDIAVTAITPDLIFSGHSVIPKVTITSLSGVAETLEAISLSDGASYNETITSNISVDPLGSNTIEFPVWTPADGTYTLTATASLSGDGNLDNNTLSNTCLVTELNYPEDAYGINGDTQEFGSFNLSTAEFTAIGAATVSPYFPVAEEYTGNAIYRAFHNSTIGIVLPETGECINIKPITGLVSHAEPTGLAWDWQKNVMYMTAVDVLGKAYFGTLDLENNSFSTISTKSNCKIIAIDMAGDGYIYGPTVNQDNLYKINPTTGDFSAVGNTGFDMNFGQDVSYDMKEDKFYSPAIIHPGDAFFGTYNLNTGALNQIIDIEDRIITFVITKSLDDNVAENTTKIEASVVPNPAQDKLQVEARGSFKVEIIDFMGRIIYSTHMENIIHIDISDAKTGVYVLRLSNAESTTTYKIVKD